MKYLAVTIGLGGHTAYEPTEHFSWGSSSSTLQGYFDAEALEKSLKDPEEAEKYEGAIVVDKSAPLGASPSLALRTPMLDVALPPGNPKRWEDILNGSAISRAVADEIKKGDHLVAGAMILAENDPDSVGMDQLPLDMYIEWWANHGARIGRVAGGKIIWRGLNEQDTVCSGS